MKARKGRKPRTKLTKTASGARKVVTGQKLWKTGRINCNWAQAHPIEHESQHEKWCMQRALLIPGLVFARHQPETLDLTMGKYTPDFELRFADGKVVIIEVKMSHKLPQYIAKFNEASAHYAKLGIRFYVITEQEITRGGMHKVVRRLLRYAKSEVSLEEQSRVLQVLFGETDVVVADLLARAEVQIEVVQHMAARRHLQCEPEFVLEQGSRVRITQVPEDSLVALEAAFGVKPYVAQAVPPLAKRSKGGLRKKPVLIGPISRHGRQVDEVTALQTLAGGAVAA